MQRKKLVFWDYKWDPIAKKSAPAHLKGTSLVQFISTSSIVIHTLDDLQKVYIDIFSCKQLDRAVATQIVLHHFGGEIANSHYIERI